MPLSRVSTQAPTSWANAQLFPKGYRYRIHPAETAFGLTAAQLSFGYEPGDLRRYGVTDFSGATNYDTAMANCYGAATAAGGWGYMLHPGGGSIGFQNTFIHGNTFSILGVSRETSIFQFNGPIGTDALVYSNNGTNAPIINTSLFARVVWRDFQVAYVGPPSAATVAKMRAQGASYFEIRNCRFTGKMFTGLAVDGVEIFSMYDPLIDNSINQAITFTALPAGTAGTLTTPWLGSSGAGYFITFSDSEIHAATFTNGSTAVTWSGAITGAPTVNATVGNTNETNFWVVNGPDLAVGQLCGFSNNLRIFGGQYNGSYYNIRDDGGSNHQYIMPNLNGGVLPMWIAGVLGFNIQTMEMENALGALKAQGEANIDFMTRSLSNTPVGACQAGTLKGCFFGADMAAGGNALKFNHTNFNITFTVPPVGSAGTLTVAWPGASGTWLCTFSDGETRYVSLGQNSTAVTWTGALTGAPTVNATVNQYHEGVHVDSCWFRNNTGGGACIDETNASGCTWDNIYTNSAQQLYTGVHNDAFGNRRMAPQNSTPGGFVQAAHDFGDTRYPNRFWGGIDAKSSGAASLQVDAQKWQNFHINITNTAGTLQYQIYDSPTTGAASAYADKIINQGTALTNLPLALAAGVGFGATAAGLPAGGNSVLVFNTNAQVAANSNFGGRIVYYDGNSVAVNAYIGIASRNINGVIQYRPEIRLVNALTGAAVNFDTTLLPAGKSIQIQINGYLA